MVISEMISGNQRAPRRCRSPHSRDDQSSVVISGYQWSSVALTCRRPHSRGRAATPAAEGPWLARAGFGAGAVDSARPPTAALGGRATTGARRENRRAARVIPQCSTISPDEERNQADEIRNGDSGWEMQSGDAIRKMKPQGFHGASTGLPQGFLRASTDVPAR